MDCYRRALEIAPYEKSSFYINIAGLLDQMNYIQDALEVTCVSMWEIRLSTLKLFIFFAGFGCHDGII